MEGGYHLADGCSKAVEGSHVSVRPLQESAVAADDFLPVIPRYATECVVHVHNGAVGKVRVCDSYALAEIGQRVVPQLEGSFTGLPLRHVLLYRYKVRHPAHLIHDGSH